MRRSWSLGPVFVLRHAGLPFDWLEDLGAPAGLLAAAREVLGRERELLAAAAGCGLPHPAVAEPVLQARPGALPGCRDPRYREAARAWTEALERYAAAFAEAEGAASEALRRLLERTELREAVFLSNPDAYHNMLVPFSRPRPLNARWRRVRRQLYTYVQRLCAKNETVSFFGPMAYGTVVPGRQVTLRAGRPRARRVFLSSWAAAELARAVAADRALRAHLPFRRLATAAAAPERDRVLAALARGGLPLPALAAALGRPPRETAALLREMVTAGEVVFGIGPGPLDLCPLATMQRALAALPASGARDHWLGRLRAVEELLTALQEAEFAKKPALVEELEDCFTRATGVPARRAAGGVYADRAVFYEECASPFSLEVGEEVARSWEERLAAALELSTAHGAAAQEAASRLVREALPGEDSLPLPAYAEATRAAFDAEGSRFAAGHAPGYPGEGWRAEAERLGRRAAALPGDRYALLDLCLSAASAAELATAPLALSRLHHHLLTDGWLATMCPDRAAFGAAAREWSAAHPEVAAFDTGRRNKGYYRFPGRRILLRRPSAEEAGDPLALRPEELSVRLGAQGPELRDAAGRRLYAYLPLSDYVKYPPYAALSHPQVLHAAFGAQGREPAVPAVRVGGVLYQRPRWTWDPAEWRLRSPAARFLQMRRAAAVTGRFVYCRSSGERKPYLVDLESVLAADLVAHVAAGAERLTAEAMWPGPEGLWLRDPAGYRYTCELRVQLTGHDTKEGS
ncbi:lantibiotic dehydratase [Streptomyces hoynatensis]|uniref:Lantibiotic dehydratase n=1 Tax=Streptomyces hoynatensis TaxID=1141874 RepID=A0A3A9Z6K3_9ACTN|nr:lantibiotic dehydratase [Streptomyces hoynatensis]RKN43991.1 lantibiotic dehydratase [Streptomyces hoynatensis]